MAILLALFCMPFIEMALFIRIEDLVGFWPTLAAILVTAAVGAAMLRRQGFGTLLRARAMLERNEVPLREMFDGVCLFVAAALLLTPGFLTDAVGFLLLIPAVRTLIGVLILARLRARADMRRGRGDVVIEGDYRDDTPADRR